MLHLHAFLGVSGRMVDDVLKVFSRLVVVALPRSLRGFRGGSADGCLSSAKVFIGRVVRERFLGRDFDGLFAGVDL